MSIQNDSYPDSNYLKFTPGNDNKYRKSYKFLNNSPIVKDNIKIQKDFTVLSHANPQCTNDSLLSEKKKDTNDSNTNRSIKNQQNGLLLSNNTLKRTSTTKSVDLDSNDQFEYNSSNDALSQSNSLSQLRTQSLTNSEYIKAKEYLEQAYTEISKNDKFHLSKKHDYSHNSKSYFHPQNKKSIERISYKEEDNLLKSSSEFKDDKMSVINDTQLIPTGKNNKIDTEPLYLVILFVDLVEILEPSLKNFPFSYRLNWISEQGRLVSPLFHFDGKFTDYSNAEGNFTGKKGISFPENDWCTYLEGSMIDSRVGEFPVLMQGNSSDKIDVSKMIHLCLTYENTDETLALASFELSDFGVSDVFRRFTIDLLTTTGVFAVAVVFAASQKRWIKLGREMYERQVDPNASFTTSFVDVESDDQAQFLQKFVTKEIERIRYSQFSLEYSGINNESDSNAIDQKEIKTHSNVGDNKNDTLEIQKDKFGLHQINEVVEEEEDINNLHTYTTSDIDSREHFLNESNLMEKNQEFDRNMHNAHNPTQNNSQEKDLSDTATDTDRWNECNISNQPSISVQSIPESIIENTGLIDTKKSSFSKYNSIESDVYLTDGTTDCNKPNRILTSSSLNTANSIIETKLIPKNELESKSMLMNGLDYNSTYAIPYEKTNTDLFHSASIVNNELTAAIKQSDNKDFLKNDSYHYSPSTVNNHIEYKKAIGSLPERESETKRQMDLLKKAVQLCIALCRNMIRSNNTSNSKEAEIYNSMLQEVLCRIDNETSKIKNTISETMNHGNTRYVNSSSISSSSSSLQNQSIASSRVDEESIENQYSNGLQIDNNRTLPYKTTSNESSQYNLQNITSADLNICQDNKTTNKYNNKYSVGHTDALKNLFSIAQGDSKLKSNEFASTSNLNTCFNRKNINDVSLNNLDLKLSTSNESKQLILSHDEKIPCKNEMQFKGISTDMWSSHSKINLPRMISESIDMKVNLPDTSPGNLKDYYHELASERDCQMNIGNMYSNNYKVADMKHTRINNMENKENIKCDRLSTNTNTLKSPYSDNDNDDDNNNTNTNKDSDKKKLFEQKSLSKGLNIPSNNSMHSNFKTSEKRMHVSDVPCLYEPPCSVYPKCPPSPMHAFSNEFLPSLNLPASFIDRKNRPDKSDNLILNSFSSVPQSIAKYPQSIYKEDIPPSPTCTLGNYNFNLNNDRSKTNLQTSPNKQKLPKQPVKFLQSSNYNHNNNTLSMLLGNHVRPNTSAIS